jgi:hypothetical protein
MSGLSGSGQPSARSRSTASVPSPSTSSVASRRSANHGTFVSSTLSHFPSLQRACTSTTPAGASRRSVVSGSRICKLVVEGAAAARVAALLEKLVEAEEGAKVVCVVSGGNVDLERLRGHVLN